MKKIILLLIVLFLFISSTTEHKTIKKQSDYSYNDQINNIIISNVSNNDKDTLLKLIDDIINISITKVGNKIKIENNNYNHFITMCFLSNMTMEVSSYYTIISHYVSNYYNFQTIGEKAVDSRNKFNMYLYHSVNKLGWT